MLKVLVLAAQNNVSDARMEYLIRDRLSWLRFLGFDLGADELTINAVKIGVLAGSIASGIAGYLVLRFAPRRVNIDMRRHAPV